LSSGATSCRISEKVIAADNSEEHDKRQQRNRPGVFIWDPFNRLCPQDHCSSWDSDGPLFFDGDHLTGHGNQILYRSFRQRVENVWSGFAASASRR
jgi:hypothetical protein